MKKYFIYLVLLVLVTSACSSKTTMESIPGTYIGKYCGCEETFELKSDGTFSQALLENGRKLYSNDGTWIASGQEIYFSNFMKALEFNSTGPKISPKLFTHFHADWTTNPTMIMFNGEFGYLAIKG